MTSYTLGLPKTVATTFSAFVENGVVNQMPGQASDVIVSGVAGSGGDYANIVRSQNVGAFLEAQVGGKLVPLAGFHSAIREAIIFDFDPPVLQVRVSDPEANEGKLRGYNLEPVPGIKGVYQGRPSWADFQEVMKLGCSETRYAPGSISMNGYIAFFYIIRLVAAFTRVSKPAKDSATTIIYANNFVGKFDGASQPVKCSNAADKIDTVQELDIQGSNGYISGFVCPIATPLDKTRSVDILEAKKWLIKDRDTWNFRYFRDMYTPDSSFVVSVVQRLFFRSLGGTPDAAANAMEFIKAGTRSLVHTPQGEAITHMLLGLQIAENAGASFFPHFLSGRYGGFSIQSPDAAIYLRGKELKAGTYQEALDFASSMNLHERRLGEIAALFETKINAEGNKKYPCRVHDIDSSRKLQDYYSLVDLGDFATDLDSLISKIDDLSFSDRYATPTFKNISIAVEFMISGDKKLLEPFHRYVRGGAIRRRDNVSVALSIFGPRVPSVNYGITFKNKFSFQIPKDSTKQDLNLTTQADGKPALQYIPVSIVNFDQGVNQWNKLLSSGTLTLAAARTKKVEFTDTTVVTSQIGGRDLATFYGLLKKGVIHFAARDSQTGKRRRAAESGEGVAVKRGKKDFENSKAVSSMIE